MTAAPVRVSPGWLRLREDADAAARSLALARVLRAAPAAGAVRTVHDLGSGTGSMGRWLAPRLDGPQHWVLHDVDPDLLAEAAARPPVAAGGAVPVETRCGDVTRPTPGALAGASLVTASALLDLLTADELGRLVRSCADTRAPVLLTLSVSGDVRLRPADPLDGPLGAAFDDHQRRTTSRGRLLGPDAVRVAVTLLHRLGYRVRVRPSPWRLDAGSRALTAEWLRGWVAAAVEQRPDLAGAAPGYLARRTDLLDRGGLRVVVHHRDVLAVPDRAGR